MPEALGFESFEALYRSDLQSVWAVVLVPAVFLVWLLRARPEGGAEPASAGFVRRWALVFGVLTVVDPICTGPLARMLPEAFGTGLLLLFVLLGDFRVFLFLFGLRDGAAPLGPALRRAAAWTLAVPAFAGPLHRVLAAAAPEIPGQSLWLLYEAAFVALALGLRHALVSDRRLDGRPLVRACLRRVLAYVALYYALWAISDALILGAGLDAGWALRVVPNQLYYAFFVPFATLTFFSARYAETSRSVQAAR